MSKPTIHDLRVAVVEALQPLAGQMAMTRHNQDVLSLALISIAVGQYAYLAGMTPQESAAITGRLQKSLQDSIAAFGN